MINGNIPDPKIGGISDTYPEVGIQRGTNAQFSMTTVSKEKLFAISPEKMVTLLKEMDILEFLQMNWD